jgi:hypothetical protein
MIPEEESVQELRTPDLMEEQAVVWGRLSSSDVVVYGSAVVSEESVSIHLNAVDVSTSYLLSKQGAQVSLDNNLSGEERVVDGIQRAVTQVSEILGPKIREAVHSVEREPGSVLLTLQGINGFGQLRRFTKFLKEKVPGVESVRQTRFKGDSINFSVGYRGGVDKLVEEMQNSSEPPFPMEFQKTTEGVISVTVR